MKISKYSQSGIYDVKIRSFLGRFLAFVFLARSATGLLGLKRRKRRQVDLLLRGSPYQKLVGVDEVLADFDVSLVDQHAGLVHALGLEPFLVDSCLKAFVQKFVEGETQHVIEL